MYESLQVWFWAMNGWNGFRVWYILPMGGVFGIF